MSYNNYKTISTSLQKLKLYKVLWIKKKKWQLKSGSVGRLGNN